MHWLGKLAELSESKKSLRRWQKINLAFFSLWAFERSKQIGGPTKVQRYTRATEKRRFCEKTRHCENQWNMAWKYFLITRCLRQQRAQLLEITVNLVMCLCTIQRWFHDLSYNTFSHACVVLVLKSRFARDFHNLSAAWSIERFVFSFLSSVHLVPTEAIFLCCFAPKDWP